MDLRWGDDSWSHMMDAQWSHREWRVRLWLGPPRCWPVKEESRLCDPDFDSTICK